MAPLLHNGKFLFEDQWGSSLWLSPFIRICLLIDTMMGLGLICHPGKYQHIVLFDSCIFSWWNWLRLCWPYKITVLQTSFWECGLTFDCWWGKSYPYKMPDATTKLHLSTYFWSHLCTTTANETTVHLKIGYITKGKIWFISEKKARITLPFS